MKNTVIAAAAFGALVLVTAQAVDNASTSGAVTKSQPAPKVTTSTKVADARVYPSQWRSSYCQALEEQHLQHRNAVAAMGRQLDRQSAGYNFDYEQNTVGLSDAMYGSLKRDNGCN